MIERLDIGDFSFDGELNHEYEMKLSIETYTNPYHMVWFNEDQAIKLINHLIAVFEIRRGDL